MKKASILLMGITMLAVSGCGNTANVSNADMEEATVKVENVVVHTTVRTTGQYPETLEVTCENDINEELSSEDFHMTGEASIWESDDKRSFEASFSDVKVDGNKIYLYPEDFPEKFFYVDTFEVTCDKNDTFKITEQDVTEVITPVADDFEYIEATGGGKLNYHLFTPEDTENKPVVVVFHGYGDTSNLLTYRTAVEWAEPENQEKRPCYVIAPVIDDMNYYSPKSRSEILDEVKALLDGMIAEGKVDSSRIYVMGNSFGGMSTIEFCEKYPYFVAGALALCPAVNYSNTAKQNLENMKDVPIWIAQAENDNTIPVSEGQFVYDRLQMCDPKDVRIKIYTDEEMNAAGADAAPDSTYSYHHVEIAVMEDDTYMEWLFEQSLE
ncbi:MAG: dienelactone hydrolase family protein [Lachnospiraceae bacterium]|nr:dienelactone hydrolase family protein [Lachnospiraceae bacterium]